MNIRLNIKNDGAEGEVILDVSAQGIQVGLRQSADQAAPPKVEEAQAALPAPPKNKGGRPKGAKNKPKVVLRQPSPAGLLGHREGEVERNGEAPG